MFITMKDFIQSLKRDVERWKAELAAAQASDFPALTSQINEWIKAGKALILDFENAKGS